ncbi:MAG: alanine dehydrogenase, partial [Kiritimatiellaeota bacterium]|nr:alanine dehydrogenase [Kiritimatiellota bacterium]
TQALTNATTPYALKLANLGLDEALRQIPELRPGLNTHAGAITYPAVATAHNLPCRELTF